MAVGAPEAGDAEPVLIRLGEEPLVLALGFRIGGFGEFVDAIGYDEAPALGELPSVRAIIIDRLPASSRPAPAPNDQLRCALFFGRSTDDCVRIGDPDALKGREVWQTFRKAKGNADLAPILPYLPERDIAPLFVAYDN